MEGVELFRTPTDRLFVGIERSIYPDFQDGVWQVMLTFGLDMPIVLGPEDDPKTVRWICVFSVPGNWWQGYLNDWKPTPEEWIDGAPVIRPELLMQLGATQEGDG